MVFPQGYDGATLRVNIVLIPRNYDPFVAYTTGLPAPNDRAVAFADLAPQFELKLVKGLNEWPIANALAPGRAPVPIAVDTNPAPRKKQLLEAIRADFGSRINITDSDAAPAQFFTVNKQLPPSYCDAFNFTGPKVPNAKTDDSYACAIKKVATKKDNWKNDEDLSWGKVFAYILRQPLLAKACGMVYEAAIPINDSNTDLFEQGAYLYADIVHPDYQAIQTQLMPHADGPFIQPYAARLPKLSFGNDQARPLFAPILFPVLYAKAGELTDPVPPPAPWDKIFAELNEYNDGFAKIVHAAQPVSRLPLNHTHDGSHPVKDEGIQLAWDDEQILLWYMRQLEANPQDPGKRIDAPLGVFGYRVDVKEDTEDATWNSLNLVQCRQSYELGGIPLGNTAGEQLELPFQVFPSQLDNDTTAPFWLPLYFAGWIGKNLVLKDTDAIAIHRNYEARLHSTDATPTKAVEAGNMFDEVSAGVDLRYGWRYQFRVRMMDISGGGPAIHEEVYNNAPAPTSKWHFKRYVAPALCRIEKPAALREVKTEFYNELAGEDGATRFDPRPVLTIQRPLLNYPAVVFTGKYQQLNSDPVQLLIQSVDAQLQGGSADAPKNIQPAIADPDVDRVEIRVEVETLRLDNRAGDSGQENYVTLYTTHRRFPEAVTAADFEKAVSLDVVFQDAATLNLGNTDDPFNDPALNRAAIDAMQDIPLPTARKVRMSIRAVCQGEDSGYYGYISHANHDLDSRYGKQTQFCFYRESGIETDLLLPKPNVPELQGLYLQPDPEYLRRGAAGKLFFFRDDTSTQPDIMQRLAQPLGLKVNGLTLVADKGERVVFGCNNRIRHHLAPDGSSITFSSKGDLCNHWITCLVYRLNRDWSWDALENTAFTISRDKKFTRDADDETESLANIGEIGLGHTASFESLQPDIYGNINRSSTTLVFIDAVEPKTALRRSTDGPLRFPDSIALQYRITAHFKPGHGAPFTASPAPLSLPSTVAPTQVPKISSVGLAFSPYVKSEKYASTEARQRYLWIELEEPVENPADTLFCRVLQYAPDQLIGNNQQLEQLMQETAEDPPLPIDPEYSRMITPGQTDDMAGLGAMQPMERAADGDDMHYLLPLPPGLHPESPELFGFFKYEFRIGHGHWSNGEEGKKNLWSTAQGRFGRPLVVAGMQHPAPTLLCNVNRDAEKVSVTAPYAKAVWKGKNVTNNPPRTQLHCVLYAQVQQADKLEYRNILLGEKLMTLVPPPQARPAATDGRGNLDTAVLGSTVARLSAVWTVEQTDATARAQVVLSNLALINEVERLKIDAAHQKKVAKAMKDYKAGKIVKLDKTTATVILDAFDHLQQEQAAPAVVPAKKFTDATLTAGAALAIYKDLPRSATASWDNKEIATLLQQYGLPEDAPLSVLAIEVFGNISSIFDHLLYVSDEQLTALQKSGNAQTAASALLSRRRKNREALGEELGNYRILRTSPLTEVPFVCCTTCG